MNKFIVAITFVLLVGYVTPCFAEDHPLGRVLISFDFNRAERDYANNQFAVWIEDLDGQLIKTLFATRYTAKGGWKIRAESLPEWARKSEISRLNKKEVDTISGATPSAQRLVYTWNADNTNGVFLPAGTYRYRVEANYYWDARVVYKGSIHLGERQNSSSAEPSYSLPDAKAYHIVENVSAMFIPHPGKQ